MRIEDYALIGDLETAALVGIDGSLDWLCAPRFDSPACLAALLGGPEHGRWLVGPAAGPAQTTRRYRGHSLVLETLHETPTGSVRVVDFMPPRVASGPAVVRVVEGMSGRVTMRTELTIRFEYGSGVPWVTHDDDGLLALKGADALHLQAPIELRGERLSTVGEFSVGAGERVALALRWHPSHESTPAPTDALSALGDTQAFWDVWAGRCEYEGAHREAVLRSLVVLKGLTHVRTGGIVAAPTTSLPETLGGDRNWDYRYCWVRDASLTVSALLGCGYVDEALGFRDWLLRASAGDPAGARIMYAVGGEPVPAERTAPWLPGYEGARPVRIGNAAVEQHQNDVYGELIEAGHLGRVIAHELGVEPPARADARPWKRNLALLAHLEEAWALPDEGIWEVRGPRRHFTHSKVMAWVAFDRAVQAVERFGLDGPLDRWRELRATIHAEVCTRAWNRRRRAFTQSYGSDELDAAVLLMPSLGFLPASDARVRSTVAAIRRELAEEGLVYRYSTRDSGAGADGLTGHEGAFLPCTLWLADALAADGQVNEARELFERVAGLANDVGLLSEEYDQRAGRLVGNFPQAFTHLALIHTARRLDEAGGTASSDSRVAPTRRERRGGRGRAA